jgi:Ca2+-transporting ATPase
VIAVIVLFAILLGFVQEYRAERAMEALRRMAAPAAKVIRDGREQTLPARELVPGDQVLLTAGDRVPADIRLSATANLRVNEAALKRNRRTGDDLPRSGRDDRPAAQRGANGHRGLRASWRPARE